MFFVCDWRVGVAVLAFGEWLRDIRKKAFSGGFFSENRASMGFERVYKIVLAFITT